MNASRLFLCAVIRARYFKQPNKSGALEYLVRDESRNPGDGNPGILTAKGRKILTRG